MESNSLYEIIAIALFIIFALVVSVVQKDSGQSELEFEIQGEPDSDCVRRRNSLEAAYGLHDLVRDDPGFSRIAFLDFVYALWQETVLRTPRADLELLRPYFSTDAIDYIRLSHRAFATGSLIDEIVIRKIWVRNVCRLSASGTDSSGRADDIFEIQLSLEGSYRIMTPAGDTERIFEEVELIFQRRVGVASKPPEKLFVVCCQSCGGPMSHEQLGETCPHCGQEYRSPLFNWHCSMVFRKAEERFDFGGQLEEESVVEDGFRDPVRVSPDLLSGLRELESGEPDFREKFRDWSCAFFNELYSLWNENNLEDMRPLLTERLLGTYRFWIEGYRRNGLRNLLKDWEIQSMELVLVERDRWFDVVTVRIKAACIDATIRESDQMLVSGSDEYPRYFSEYWTFCRSLAPFVAERLSCPRCAAALTREDQAFCDHCGSRIVRVTSDWKLALIEQADTYFLGGEEQLEETEQVRHLWPPPDTEKTPCRRV